MKELEGYLNNTINNLEETAKGFEGLKQTMFDLMLNTFNQVFEMKDQDGNPIYQSLKEPEIKELIESIDEYMIPLYKEDDNKEGLKKCEEYKKLLQENLEK